jgi:hypothetical protein
MTPNWRVTWRATSDTLTAARQAINTRTEPFYRAAEGIRAIMRPPTALRFMREQLPDYVDQNHVMAAGDLIREADRQGMTLTWPEALSQVTGRPVLSDVQRILESSRQSKAQMSEALSDRPAQVRQAGENVAGSIGPPMLPEQIGRQASTAAQDTLTAARQAINTRTRTVLPSG